MKSFLGALGFALVCFAGVACAGVEDDAADPAGDEAMGEDDLRTAGIKTIRVNNSAGFRPPPRPGQCWPSGTWTFDVDSRTLTGNACVDAKRVTVDKVLSEADAARVKTAVSKVRIVAKPPACPTDMPVTSLTVTRAKSETRYVDQRAACGAASTPVKEATLDDLVTLMEELSPAGSATLPACVKTGCSGQVCADHHIITTCQWRPQDTCFSGAICERGANGACGFRSTPELTACLANQ